MRKTLGSPPAAHGTPKTARQPTRRHILRACAKHASHAHFLPVRKLSRQTFSGDEGARSEDILRVVRHLARWVVRVRVMKTSPARAAGGGKRSAAAHTCTGLATCVGKDYVIVSVPSHAVRDEFEARNTTADFFYDSDDSTEVITVQGLSLTRRDPDHTAQLTCRACPELGHRFRSQEGKSTRTEAPVSLRESVDLRCVKSSEKCLAILISHPHGFPKRVSLGRFCGVDVQSEAEVADGEVTASRDPTAELPQSVCAASVGMLSLPPSSSSLSSSSSSSSLSPLSASATSSSPAASESWQILPSLSGSLPSPSESDELLAPSLKLTSSSTAAAVADDGTHPHHRRQASDSTCTISSLGLAMELCERTVSFWKAVCRLFWSLGRADNSAGPLQRGTHNAVRVYHDAASCPGSSGGAVLLIGRRAWAGLSEALTSLPVFVHVGRMSGQQRGVAVPVAALASSKQFSVCFC